MSRLARVVVPGAPHHVTQRGVRRMAVFFSPSDFLLYRALLRRAAERHGLEVWSYCLMPNHVHLVAVPRSPTALARALQETHTRYAEKLNRRSGWRGHLWQQRFSSSPMDERHLYFATRYVLRNPVRAGLVDRAIDWPWSSATAHSGLRKDALLPNPDLLVSRFPGLLDGLDEVDAEALDDELRLRTRTGRPLGDEGFVRAIEDRLGRSLAPQRRGRRSRPGAAGDS